MEIGMLYFLWATVMRSNIKLLAGLGYSTMGIHLKNIIKDQSQNHN